MKVKPVLSTAGNPFPPGLKPVFVPLACIPGVSPGRMWPHPLDPSPPKPDFSAMITTDTYLYEPLDADTPRFKLRLEPRRKGESEAQYAAYRRALERQFRVHGVYLRLIWLLCGALGNFRSCRQRECRRKKACTGRRDGDACALEIAVFPPCVPIDLDIMESYRQAVRAELGRLYALHNGPDSGWRDFMA